MQAWTCSHPYAHIFISPSDLAKIYSTGDNNAQTFIRHLTIFITSYLKAHISLLENGDDNSRQALNVALTILLRISKVEDSVIFKICLEYWSVLVRIACEAACTDGTLVSDVCMHMC